MTTPEFNAVYEKAKKLFLKEIHCKPEDLDLLPETVMFRIEKASGQYALSVIHIRRTLEKLMKLKEPNG